MPLRALPKTLGLSPAEAAAVWAQRHDRGDLSQAEADEFARWHEEPAHARAYARAEAALALFDADDGSDAHLAALRQAPAEVAMRPAPGAAPERSAASRREFVTAVGERRTIRLPDGTTVILNTRTRLVEAFAQGRRLVRLLEGQALFEVAHDASRPFVVEAADRHVTALGTVFEVRVDPGRMHVLLIEGRVAVESVGEAGASGSRPAAPAILAPGQEYVAALGMAQQVARVDVARQTLWRDGFVEFDDEPLSRAVAEMNRYSEHPIVLADGGIGSLRLSGVFRTGQPDRFVNIVSEILPVEAQPTGDGSIRLSARR